MSSIPLRLPDDLKERTSAQTEAEHYLASRAVRTLPEQERKILAHTGQGNPPFPGDEPDAENEHP